MLSLFIIYSVTNFMNCYETQVRLFRNDGFPLAVALFGGTITWNYMLNSH